MQAYADRAALNETLQKGCISAYAHFELLSVLVDKLRVECRACRLATFYSRSRKGRWCKGETSGHFIKVLNVYLDCDRDSIIYQGEPVGPACHTVLCSGVPLDIHGPAPMPG